VSYTVVHAARGFSRGRTYRTATRSRALARRKGVGVGVGAALQRTASRLRFGVFRHGASLSDATNWTVCRPSNFGGTGIGGIFSGCAPPASISPRLRFLSCQNWRFGGDHHHPPAGRRRRPGAASARPPVRSGASLPGSGGAPARGAQERSSGPERVPPLNRQNWMDGRLSELKGSTPLPPRGTTRLDAPCAREFPTVTFPSDHASYHAILLLLLALRVSSRRAKYVTRTFERCFFLLTAAVLYVPCPLAIGILCFHKR
jgi:hypothetical protein